jgi:hypothetical protein
VGSFTKLGVGNLDTNKHHATAHIGMHGLPAALCIASVILTDWEHVGTEAHSASTLRFHSQSWSSCAKLDSTSALQAETTSHGSSWVPLLQVSKGNATADGKKPGRGLQHGRPWQSTFTVGSKASGTPPP